MTTRRFNASARSRLDRTLRTKLVDPTEVIELGKIATAAPVDKTTPQEKRLKELAAAYRVAGGILARVPNVSDAENLRYAEEARVYLVAYVPTKIRNMDRYFH